MKKIKKGDIAINGLNKVGLITDDEMQDITLRSGKHITTYVGIQLTSGTVEGIKEMEGRIFELEIGDQWLSKDPTVIGHIDEFVERLETRHQENLYLFKIMGEEDAL